MMSGASVPVTLAGAIVVANAEALSGLVMHQLRAKGAPIISGFGTSTMDMRTSTCVYGCPEYRLALSACADLYHHYGLPLPEEMLFGLGEGINFMYWEQKGSPPFIGGRGNIKSFVQDIGERTGVVRFRLDRAADTVGSLDRPHPIRIAGDGVEHLDEPVIGVHESSPREHRLVRGHHHDRVRRLVRIHPDDHWFGHCSVPFSKAR